jgi:hypothetical protein
MAKATKKFRNFDDMIAERKAVSPSFEMFGKVYILAPSLRYDALLELHHLAKRKNDEVVSDDDTFSVFESVLGKETLDELRAHTDFDVDLAAEIVRWVLDQYGIGQKATDDNDPKEAAA